MRENGGFVAFQESASNAGKFRDAQIVVGDDGHHVRLERTVLLMDGCDLLEQTVEFALEDVPLP